MKKTFLAIILLLVSLAGNDAFALGLDEARTQGLVGETLNGYIEPVSQATPEVQALTSEINSKRKQEYQEISARNGQPLDVVEKLAAGKIIAKLGSGQYYKDQSGNWVKK